MFAAVVQGVEASPATRGKVKLTMSTKPVVYILKSLKDGKFYIGSTINLERRLKQHTLGKVRSTKGRRPLKLVYIEEFDNIKKARSREYEIKKMKGGIKFKKLISKAAVVQG